MLKMLLNALPKSAATKGAATRTATAALVQIFVARTYAFLRVMPKQNVAVRRLQAVVAAMQLSSYVGILESDFLSFRIRPKRSNRLSSQRLLLKMGVSLAPDPFSRVHTATWMLKLH